MVPRPLAQTGGMASTTPTEPGFRGQGQRGTDQQRERIRVGAVVDKRWVARRVLKRHRHCGHHRAEQRCRDPGTPSALGELRAAAWPAPEHPDSGEDTQLGGRDNFTPGQQHRTAEQTAREQLGSREDHSVMNQPAKDCLGRPGQEARTD